MSDNHDPSPRYLDVTELSVEQLVQREQARRRGEEVHFENPAYIAARRELLREHGLEDEGDPRTDPDERDPEKWSVDRHLSEMRKAR